MSASETRNFLAKPLTYLVISGPPPLSHTSRLGPPHPWSCTPPDTSSRPVPSGQEYHDHRPLPGPWCPAQEEGLHLHSPALPGNPFRTDDSQEYSPPTRGLSPHESLWSTTSHTQADPALALLGLTCSWRPLVVRLVSGPYLRHQGRSSRRRLLPGTWSCQPKSQNMEWLGAS